VDKPPSDPSYTHAWKPTDTRRKWFFFGAGSGAAAMLAVFLLTASSSGILPLASNSIPDLAIPSTQNQPLDAYSAYMDSVSWAAASLETQGANSTDPAGCDVVGFDARFNNYVINVWVENLGPESNAYYTDYRVVTPEGNEISRAWDLFDHVGPSLVGKRQGYSAASEDHRWTDVSCEVYLLTEASLGS